MKRMFQETVLILVVIAAMFLLASSARAGRGACVICEDVFGGAEEVIVVAGCYDDDPIDGSHMTPPRCEDDKGGYGGEFFAEQYCNDKAPAAAWADCPGAICLQTAPFCRDELTFDECVEAFSPLICETSWRQGETCKTLECPRPVPTMAVEGLAGLTLVLIFGALVLLYRRERKRRT